MTDTLFIRFAVDPDAAVEWLHTAEPQVVHSGSLQDAASARSYSEAIVFVPSAHLVLCRTEVPTRNRSRMLQALPYALEEQLAQDVDQLHFAAGAPADATVPAAVVARPTLETWLEHLHAAGIEPRALVPDVLALPWQADTWTVLSEAHQALVRTGAGSGWSAEPDNVAYLLNAQTRQGTVPTQIRILSAADASAPIVQIDAVEPTHETLQEPVLALLARQYRNNPSIDLLQGPYQRLGGADNGRRRWRWVAALALLLVGVELTAGWIEHYRLGQRLEQAQQRIETQFRAAFPDVRRIVDAKVQMQQRLERLRKTAATDNPDGAFLDLLARAAPAFEPRAQMRINRLQYRNQSLEVDLNAPSFESLDRIKQALSARGLVAEVVSASAAEQGVSGRLRVQGGAS